MSDNQNSEQPNCMDRDTEADILLPEAHHLVEIEQDLLLELNDRAVYKITRECRRGECQSQYHSHNVVGPKITTVADLKQTAYELYESCYNNPRNIPHSALQSLVDVPHPGKRNAIANNLADASKLGHNDADSNREKRMRQELIDTVLPDDL